MKLLLALRALALLAALACTLLSLVLAAPLGGRLRSIGWLAGVVAAGSQLTIEFERVLGRRAPWTRLLFPAIAVAATASAFFTHGPATVAVGTALAISAPFEVFALGLAAFIVVRAIRNRGSEYPEDVVERELRRFAPSALNRLLVVEPALVFAAIGYAFGGFRRPLPTGFSYVRTWSLVPVLLAAPVIFLPEGLVFDFILAHTDIAWGWRALNGFVHLYSVVWVLGILATARLRPHRLDDERVRFRFGMLKRIDLERANIAQVRALGALVDVAAFRRGLARDTYSMALEGAPAVEVTLREPIAVGRFFGGERRIRRVVVAADDPIGLAAALA